MSSESVEIDQLYVGGICGRGHEIRKDHDLITRRGRKNRCRRCVNDARAESTHVRRYTGYYDPITTLLDRGICSAGHVIGSEADTLLYDGKWRCAKCVRIAKRESDMVRTRVAPDGGELIVDSVVVERAIHGWQGPMNAAEFQAAVDELVVRGFTNTQIANRLHAALRTIERHVHR